jgi:fructose-bisphosphate aldolase class II
MKNILIQALRGETAVPAFNFYNLESFRAISAAAAETRRPVIFAASESAIKYMGGDFLRFVAQCLNSPSRGGGRSGAAPAGCILHLDHGHTFEACKNAISLGFHSVMIDGSDLPFAENVRLTRRVVQYAHKHGVAVEAELGMLSGTEDYYVSPISERSGRKAAEVGLYTDPAQAKKFVELTGCDSLAIAIGTSHGAYKMKPGEKLRFDILAKIRALLPKTPLVLHGASQIPQKYAQSLGLKKAEGIPAAQIRHAVRLGINKVNVDSDARLAWSATMKSAFARRSDNFDPRHYLALATAEMTELYKKEISIISG